MREYVIDASVAVKLFIADALSPKVIALFDMLGALSPPVLHAPDLLYSEVTGALRKRALLAGYPHARRDVLRLYEIPFRVAPCRELMAEAIGISLDRVISSYDAFYVALSRRLKVPLVTADERLVRAVLALPGYDVRSLAGLKISGL